MQLSKEQIEMLERLGAAFISITSAAIVIEVDADELKRELFNKKSHAFLSYYKGVYRAELELREAIQKMAARGSSPAQKMLLDLRTSMLAENQ